YERRQADVCLQTDARTGRRGACRRCGRYVQRFCRLPASAGEDVGGARLLSAPCTFGGCLTKMPREDIAPASRPGRKFDVPPNNRAQITNDPLAGINRKTVDGRRLADLFVGYWAAMGRPDDPVAMADCRAAAELKQAAEAARAALLAGANNAEDVVR